MAKKKRKPGRQMAFQEMAYATLMSMANQECVSHQAAVAASSSGVISLSILAVAEQLRIANLLSLAEEVGTRNGDAAWHEITGRSDPDDAEGFAPWVARALGIETREEGGGDE
ncbi:hypothetical protein NSA19_02815 [Actinomyces bowdenii]|uniref:hypothetical protein n=1 Tax=Actinomyces bowdenii TaxID=131109 RepID=UPI00214BC6A8|nr:hypothetical protein [Actinomyces bowdenii]MCR2051801.1 hypothetical protein [Actinomyces bowdenii]